MAFNNETQGQDTSVKERLLVVGGGGSRGAWGAGFAKYLAIKKHQQPYRYVFGTSTGSLMAPMIVLNDFETLKDAYTGVAQEDIFDVNPFKSNGDLKVLKAVWRLITGKKTFGESYNLRKLIDKFLTNTRYEEIITAKPERKIVVCTVNYKNGKAGYTESGKDISWEIMGNWIWASANQPIFMTFVDLKYLPGGSYVDGGVRENIPIIEALTYAHKHNISEIDIIVNKPRDPVIEKEFKPKGILKNLLRLIELWETEVRDDDITIAILLSKLRMTDIPKPAAEEKEEIDNPKFNLHFHFIPVDLFKENFNECIFSKPKMQKLWVHGEDGKEEGQELQIKISRKQVNQYLTAYNEFHK